MDAMGVIAELSEGEVDCLCDVDVCAMSAGAATELCSVPKGRFATVRWQGKV